MKVKTRGNLIELMSSAGATAPEWVNLLPAGELTTSDGLRYLVDQAAMNYILAAVNARRVDLVIDYEHQTYEGGQAPAAGWVKELQTRPDGLWGRVEWTPQGRDYVANREYRYLSPVIMVSKQNRRVLDMVAVGLTNVPRINDFPPLTNKDKGDQSMNWLEKLTKLLGLDAGASEEQAVAAVEKTLNSARGLLATLRTLVGLGEGAEAPQVLETVKTELNKAKAAPGQVLVVSNSVLAALKLPEGSGESAVLGAIRGLQEGSQQLETLQNRLVALEKGDLERQANRLVDTAM
ncbi:MAG: phage protease, partial [Pseudomonadota bacterium]